MAAIFRWGAAALLAGLAAAAPAGAAGQRTAPTLPSASPVVQPDLGWLAGYWLSCEDGREVMETWSPPAGGVQIGHSITVAQADGFWEQMRIEATGSGPTDVFFHALPRGQAGGRFRLLSAGPQSVVFQNEAHDFPQRVSYRRDGDRLIGRIEGVVDGRERSAEWRYRAAPFNSRCKEEPKR